MPDLPPDLIVEHPATRRNSEPLWEVIEPLLATAQNAAQGAGQGRQVSVLEVASGGGLHVELFASRSPAVGWQPSEPDPALRASVDARVARAGLRNVRPALALDVRDVWPNERFDLLLATNMVHISPWAATQALIAGAAEVLEDTGVLLLYGPYRRNGEHTSAGNSEFDASLRGRNPQWGIRDMEAVAELAGESGLTQLGVQSMPANNFCLLFARQGSKGFSSPLLS